MLSNRYPTLFGCATDGGGRVVIVGVPYDRGTDATRAGCAEAPAALRTLSEGLGIRGGQLHDLQRRTSVVDGRLVSDLGNLRFHPHQSDDAYLQLVSKTAQVIAAEGKRPLFLGGDHLITLAALRGLAAAGRRFQVIQLDAHHDHARIDPGERPTHATFMGHVAAEGLAVQVLQIGVRGLTWGAPPAVKEIAAIAIDELAAALIPEVDVYVTVDTDAFDPGVAPGVGYPEPEGLSLAALVQVLAHIRRAGLHLIGADWTEYNPRYDTANGVTARVVLRGLALILEHLLAAAPPSPAAVETR